jgi:hypothetical protein
MASRSRANEPLTPPTSPRKSTWAAARSLLGPSLSRCHAVVGTLAGVASIMGAAFTLVEFVRPANTGSLVTVVQAAGSRANVTDATIEVLTPESAIVATLTPDSTGRATHQLTEGVYVVRVSHPRYAPEVRRVHVRTRQTVEMRASLRPGSSSPIKRAVNGGVSAVRKALRF